MSICLIAFRKRVSTAHIYMRPEWNDEKNLAHFGKCFSKFGHGHNYEIDFSWRFDAPAEKLQDLCTNVDFSEAALSTIETVCRHYDHNHLNHTHAAFKTGRKISTTENLALQIWEEFQLTWANRKPSSKNLAVPSGVVVWEMSDLASCVGLTPFSANANLNFNHVKKRPDSQIKFRRINKSFLLGKQQEPCSILMKLESRSDDQKLSDEIIHTILETEAKSTEHLASLAARIATKLDRPIYIRELAGLEVYATH